MDWIKVIEWMAGILGSLIVVYCTQQINDRFFVPKNTLKALLQEIDATISYYANVIANPGVVNKELEIIRLGGSSDAPHSTPHRIATSAQKM